MKEIDKFSAAAGGGHRTEWPPGSLYKRGSVRCVQTGCQDFCTHCVQNGCQNVVRTVQNGRQKVCTKIPVVRVTPLQRWSFAEKNRFFYECLTKKVLNRNSAPINKELIDFPKGEDKITSICFMISDGEVPPDVVPTAYCHSKSLNTHTH
jgi:hypothetical protein